MTAVDGPRLVTPEEFPAMMELLDRYFAYERGGMQARLPFAYDPAQCEHHAIIAEEDQVVSHIGAIPQTLSTGVNGETIECWGIGGVATDRRYRGNGYMSQLLEFWFDQMNDADVPLTELSGNRQRYAHFGYENAGVEYQYALTERSFDGTPSASGTVAGYDTDEHLELIHRIHESEPYRVVRDRADTQTVLGQRGLETIVYEDSEEPAYVSLSRESRERTIEEFGGSDSGLDALLSHLLMVLDLNELTARVPPWHHLEPLFAQHSRFWTARPHRKFCINDLPAVIDAFGGQLEARWLESGRTDTGAVVLGIEEAAAVRIEYGPDAVTIEQTTDKPSVECSRMGMTALLFGMSDRTARLRAVDPFLDTVLPLRFFVWPSEHV